MRSLLVLFALCFSAASMADDSYIEGLVGQCESLGFSRNDPSIKQCLLQMHQNAQNEQQARRANILNYLIANQPRQPTQTNCYNTIGGGVQCNTR